MTYFTNRRDRADAMVEGLVVGIEVLTPAFYGPVFLSAPIGVGGDASVGAASPDTEAWARKIVVDCLQKAGYPSPSLGMIQIVQAIGRLEGFYGKASNPPEWAGSNNWGAVQSGRPGPDGSCPVGSFGSTDTSPKSGTTVKYKACFRKYATPEEGCADMLRIMLKSPRERAAVEKGDVLATSTAMYDAGYYEGMFKDRDKAIAQHAATVSKNVKAISEALKEPIGTAATGKNAQGEEIDASPLLFALLPVGFGLAKMLVHMVGDPLVVTPSMAQDKIEQVNTNYGQTDDEYSKAIQKKKIGLDLYKAWTAQFTKWRLWSQGNRISVSSAASDYEEAKRYDLTRYEYALKLEKAGAAPPGKIPETPPPPVDPGGGVLGGGNPLSSLASNVGSTVALVGGAWLAWQFLKR